MKKEIIEKIIAKGESETLEFKPSLSQINEIVEIISSFANTEGGKIIIGVSDSGKIKGVEIGKGTIENLANTIAQNTEPKIQPHITVEKLEDKNIIVIDVTESMDRLVLASGRPYKRVGKSSPRMSKEEYEKRILEKHKEKLQFDKQICKGASLKDMDKEKVKWFVKKGMSERGLDIKEDASTEEALMRLKLIRNGKLTNAAVLLFGKNPQNFFAQSEVKCIKFKGINVTGTMLDSKIITGNIIDQIVEIEKFVFDHISLSSWIENGKIERQEKWEYPPKATREALVNAVAHRDYTSSSNVQVRIFDDRIEFWNPGRLPDGWTVETLKQKHESDPWNPLIAKMFFWIRYIEEVGTGTNKIIQWCAEWGLSEPKFEFTGTSIVVTLYSHKLTEEFLKKLNLNERQKKALEHIRTNEEITLKEYKSLCPGVTDRTLFQDLNILVKKGVLKAIGEKRGRKYTLT